MHYDLELAKKRIERLDKARIARALEGATTEFQHVFQLLPLLLHLNHSGLPGFLPDAAEGIADFVLSDYQRKYLMMNLPTEQANTLIQKITQKQTALLPVIEGVYVMGSISSVAQTTESDLDIWVCHRSQLSSNERDKLLQKAIALQNWARNFKVEMNLFFMDQQRFRSFQHVDSLSTENSGSAQHILLLDEFYRSTIRLAGKPLLWLHLAVKDEQYYDKEVQRLVQEQQLDLNQWVDFGGLGALSANEYFGATLWQLFKGIDSPYKAVIKILLLEAYSWEYPQTNLVALDFKQRFLHGENGHFEQFDPYMAMLDRVTEYLTRIEDFSRLDFVRRCFYAKAHDSKNEHIANWRNQQLAQLVENWQWPPALIEELNQRGQWKIKRVKQTYNRLVQVLMLSYRNLVNFARKHKVDASIMPQDITVLTRKLYTAFEELPNKITLLNPQISNDLSENHLTFIEVNDSRHLKAGWYLVNQAPYINELSQMRYVEFNPHLHKLVAWAYFNGLLTANTELHISSRRVSLETLREFVADLRLSLPATMPPATDADLQRNCKIRDLMVVVNLNTDPTQHLSNDSLKQQIQQSDLFSFGAEEKSLVGSVALIYRNMWNEIRTLHFEGANAILTALKTLSYKIHKGATAPTIHVFCYSQYYRQALRNVLSVLIHKCVNVQTGYAINQQPINMLRVAGKTWQFFFEEKGINLQEIKGVPVLGDTPFGQTLQQKITPPEVKVDRTLKYPFEIDFFASEGFLQFFFEDNQDQTFNVYILDELNRIEIYRNCEGEKEQKIREINRIYTTANGNGENPYCIVQHDFNYPQFYQLISQNGQARIVPFHSRIAH
ncbi:class I adenylate cyclase [Conservatibacter flavescens]|uniref:Adenylate cyclase n=1 Tax=Conservatibacter flavescens TaxID=28161 RepID=A0A2M8S4U9_9PAST|nr:class I adenylate cyclase [Conservatibacter flavescens]PJG86165.1 class I adenylate cyclase [Conservatibacter flavescens]